MGDVSAVINHLSLSGSAGQIDNPSASPVTIGLNAFTNNQVSLDVPISAPQDSLSYNTFNFEVDAANVDNGNGTLDSFTQQGQNNSFPPVVGIQPLILDPIPANVVAATGRTTSLQVFFDDSMLNTGSDNANTIAFDGQYNLNWYPALFSQANVDNNQSDPSFGRMESFYSDMFMFDIHQVPGLPTFDNGTSQVERAYFSGDNIGVSGAPGTTTGNFAMLTTLGEQDGSIFTVPPPAPETLPNGTQVTFPGTYNLLSYNPNNVSLNKIATVSSLLGVYRPFTEGVTIPSTSTFEIFTIPNSYESPVQEMVVLVLKWTSGVPSITNFYWGDIDLSRDLFQIYPAANLVNGSTSGVLSGTVTAENGVASASAGTVAAVAAVKTGQVKFTGGPVPAGFPALNTATRFLVIRE